MATAKRIPIQLAAKKAAPKPSASRALQPWEAEMAAQAKAAATAERIQGLKTIGTRGGIMKIDGEVVKGNALRCVVLGSVYENQWFEGDFDPDRVRTPACYSFGDPDRANPEDGMAPHAQARDKQSELCANCHFNKMGTAEKGKGKACKNVRRLAVVTEDALESADDLSTAEIRLMKVPVMSTNNWAKYVHRLNEDMQRAPQHVVTEISLHPDDKSQFRVEFEFQELVSFDQKLYDAAKSKVAQAKQALLSPYPNMDDEEEKKPARGGKAAPAKRAKY